MSFFFNYIILRGLFNSLALAFPHTVAMMKVTCDLPQHLGLLADIFCDKRKPGTWPVRMFLAGSLVDQSKFETKQFFKY